MNYHIKPEYYSLWGEYCDETTVVPTDEVVRLAREWDKEVDELVDETDLVRVGEDEYVSIAVLAEYMDNDIRENLCGIYDDPDEFYAHYCEEHMKKYGVEFKWR